MEMSNAFLVWMWAAVLGFGCMRSSGQDLEAALDDWPVVSAALLQALEGNPSFAARAEIEIRYHTETKPTTASGICAWQKGNLRWDISLTQLRGPLLSQQMIGAVNQLHVGPIIALARSGEKRTALLLSGAKAHLEATIPDPDRKHKRAQVELGRDMLGQQACSKERFSWTFAKRKAEVVVWKLPDAPRWPVQVRILLDNCLVLVRFREPRPLALGANRFVVPAGSAKYADFTDLIQSLLWQRMKSRLGWPSPK
jgi:hypothetical protein